ncbi:MAG TPA: BrnT family toxin [Verrucomicrobiae bacterium]
MAAFEFNFEWDVRKAAANVQKHAVSFEHAATVFKDPKAMSLFDQKHSADEDRWITLGLDNRGQLLVVCHTWRETEGGAASCRIISARKAGRKEAGQYRNQTT